MSSAFSHRYSRGRARLGRDGSRRMALFCALSLLALGCTKQTLVPLQAKLLNQDPNTTVKLSFCTDPAFTQKDDLKTLIILDHSGSNQENYLLATDGSGGPALVGGKPVVSKTLATDPTGSLRYGNLTTPGTLLNYLYTAPANDPANPSRFFALVDFNSAVTTYPANSAGFSSDIVDFYNHVAKDSGNGSPNDSGATDYIGALNAAYNIINNDIQAADRCAKLPAGSASPGAWCPVPGVQVSSSYVIVFMSDGAPVTDVTGIGVDNAGNVVVTGPINITVEPSNQILGQVASIMALTSNTRYVTGINLFSVYYYSPSNIDRAGQQLLSDMAKVGNGLSYNALSGSNLDYTRFAPPAKRIKYTLSDVFVSNESTVWWKDGKLHLDTDLDGLPDDVEKAWGSDPLNAQTDGNGVSDLVKYQATKAKACAKLGPNGLCQDAVTDYSGNICQGLKTTPVAGRAGAISYPSSDPSGMNDCEKLVLNDAGGIGAPDSNGDLIPDWLEFRNGVAFQLGAPLALDIPDLDGVSLYQKIKQSLPIAVPKSQILNATPVNYDLNLVSTSDTHDCYSLTASPLPIIGSGNQVRIDLIMKSQLLSDRYVYKVGRKRFSPTTPGLTFGDWNDPAEQSAGTWSGWP